MMSTVVTIESEQLVLYAKENMRQPNNYRMWHVCRCLLWTCMMPYAMDKKYQEVRPVPILQNMDAGCSNGSWDMSILSKQLYVGIQGQ